MTDQDASADAVRSAPNLIALPSVVGDESARVFDALDGEVAKLQEGHGGRLSGFALVSASGAGRA